MADSLGPIITDQEWLGLLNLHNTFPNASFNGISGGVSYWFQAAGIEVTDDNTATFTVIQTDRHNQQVPKNPIASFGRFSIVKNNEPDHPNPCGDGICDIFEKKHEFVCPGDCPR